MSDRLGIFDQRSSSERFGMTSTARSKLLGEIGDFFVEMGEGGFQGFAVIGVGGGRQIVQDARAR